jgi:hypothetical protein
VSETYDKVRALLERREVRVSDHGYDEISDEDILARDVAASVFDGIEVEDYPMYAKGPCVLVLQRDFEQRPVHVVWGIPRDLRHWRLFTAYRPRPELWSEDFTRRKT